MLNRKALLLFLLLPILTGFASPVFIYESSLPVRAEEDLVLLPLVGEKIILELQSGEKISGTLWDYTDTYLTLKIKKGLLYSKAEQFQISEISTLEDPDGKKHDIRKIFSASLSSQEGEIGAQDQNIIQNTLQIVTFTDEDETPQEEAQSAPQITQETIPDVSATMTPIIEADPVPAISKPSAQITQKNEKTSVNRRAPRQSKKQKVTPAEPDTPEDQEVASIHPEEVESLQYQNYILYASAILLIAIFIVYKSFGLKGFAFAKQSLFPTRMIRMNGPYGIIDQGREDGVKVADVVRLYRKSDNLVQYKGKVRVTKVAQNYSAVEIISTKGDAKIGAGDVGVRDRNRVGATLKNIRSILSLGLNATAKGLAATAKNIAVKNPGSEDQNAKLLEPKHESEIHEVTEMVRTTRVVDLPQKNKEEPGPVSIIPDSNLPQTD